MSSGLLPWRGKVIGHKTAIFRQVNKDKSIEAMAGFQKRFGFKMPCGAGCWAHGEDLSISVFELHRLATLGPHSADLLLRRMAALDLDKKEVSEIAPQTLQELQQTCTLCSSRS